MRLYASLNVRGAIIRGFCSSPHPNYPRAAPSKTHLHQPIPDTNFPQGFVAGSVYSGIKKKDVPDLGVLVSKTSRTSAAACFTRNAFKAAPVIVSTEVLKTSAGRARALVVNSGCANAVTGKKGMEDAWTMATATDKIVASVAEPQNANETLVMSTGVIGQNLPIEKISAALASQELKSTLGSSFGSWERLARAFMTTDTFPKLRARSFNLMGKEVRMAGIDKGAGMIHPNMGPPGEFYLFIVLSFP